MLNTFPVRRTSRETFSCVPAMDSTSLSGRAIPDKPPFYIPKGECITGFPLHVRHVTKLLYHVHLPESVVHRPGWQVAIRIGHQRIHVCFRPRIRTVGGWHCV